MLYFRDHREKEDVMNWGREQKLEAGPLSEEELKVKYPGLPIEEDEDLSDLKVEEVKRYDHVPEVDYLVLMKMLHGSWVVVFQNSDQQVAEQRMLEIDDEIDGVYELRFVELVTQTLVEREDDDARNQDQATADGG